MGFRDGEPVASISVVRYDGAFGFLGFYIVRPKFRGLGYGWRIWQEGMDWSRRLGYTVVAAQPLDMRPVKADFGEPRCTLESSTGRGQNPALTLCTLQFANTV